MRKFVLLLAVITLMMPITAQAHQPVALLASDTTAEKGPLLVDGTVSFAIRASFTKANEVRAFRAQLAAGDRLSIQYLIIDKTPENKLKVNQLPVVTITSPTGIKTVLKVTERTRFFEPFSETNYLYLTRYQGVAEPGIYAISIKSKVKSAVTVAVGEKEIPGEVIRGVLASPKPSVTPSQSATPAPSISKAPTLTMKDVEANSTAKSCWSVIDGNVYNLTRWINSHPGGAAPILFLCGIDGTKAFAEQHAGEGKPASRLAGYLMGPLSK